jgi:hypothetical protein
MDLMTVYSHAMDALPCEHARKRVAVLLLRIMPNYVASST